MTSAAKSPYAGYRFPGEVISHVVWLYFRFPLSLRMVEEMLAARGIDVSHETVRQWAAVMAHVPSWCSRHGWTLVAPDELARLASLQLVATRRLRRVQDERPRTASACQGGIDRPLEEASVGQVNTIGLDIAKRVFQAHGGTVNLIGSGRDKAHEGRPHEGLCPSGHAGDLGPGLEGLGPGGSMLAGGAVIAAEVEEVGNLIVSGEEALSLAG